MSPLEEYQEARRSGATRTHPDTLANWPDKTSEPLVAPPEPKSGSIIKVTKSKINWHWWEHVMIIIILIYLLFFSLKYPIMPVSDNRPEPEVVYKTITKYAKPKVIYKTKVKKVYVVSNDDTWRRRLCYFYSDPKACRVYGRTVPKKIRTSPWGDGILGRYIKTIQGR